MTFQVNPKGLVEILNTSEHEVRSLQHVPLRETWAASFHRDGHRNIAIGTRSGNVLIWDTKMKTITKSFPTPSQQASVNLLSFNARNTNLAASMQNGDTIIYGCATNIPVLTVNLLFSKSISAMKFHHESRAMLGLATEEGHLVMRDISTNKDRVVFENAHAAPITDFVFSAVNKDVMLSCGLDKAMHIYDIRLNNVVSTVRASQALTALTINCENQVALGSKNGSLFVYDLRDFTNPLQVLKDHDEGVRRVAFQPIRKKVTSPAEASIKEDSELWSPNPNSPLKANTSDMFMMGDSPMKNNSNNQSNTQDSKKNDTFLMMMGLDQSNNNDSQSVIGDGINTHTDSLYRQFDAEKNQMSTPINTKTSEQHTPLPIFNNKAIENQNLDLSGIRQTLITHKTTNTEPRSIDDIKDFLKLNLADVADDNRNYFLHIMMALTKQKLFLEKQLSGMNNQINKLVKNQGDLVESNRRLTLEIEHLKSRSQSTSNS